MDVKTLTAPRHSMLAEHARGDSLRTIGKRHGIGHETARRLILQTGSSLIRDLMADLLVGEAHQKRGQEPEWPTMLIPFGLQAQDWADSLDFFSWAVKQLRNRDFDVQVVTRHVPEAGVVFMLTLPPWRRSS